MTRGPSWPQGLPELPYPRKTSYAGQDVLIALTFLNSLAVPAQPTSISYRIDSLETGQVIQGPTSLTPTGTSQTLQLPGSVMVLTRQWLGRDNFQVAITAVIPDTNATSGSITVNQVVIIELCAIAVGS